MSTGNHPSLERMARCSQCGRIEPSIKWESLAFFEPRGEGTATAKDHCKCGYYEVAHRFNPDSPLNRNVVSEGLCAGFEPHGAYEYDTFYCGCRGWD
jgi:hypothetical protein